MKEWNLITGNCLPTIGTRVLVWAHGDIYIAYRSGSESHGWKWRCKDRDFGLQTFAPKYWAYLLEDPE